jgi:hypothetical protein
MNLQILFNYYAIKTFLLEIAYVHVLSYLIDMYYLLVIQKSMQLHMYIFIHYQNITILIVLFFF